MHNFELLSANFKKFEAFISPFFTFLIQGRFLKSSVF